MNAINFGFRNDKTYKKKSFSESSAFYIFRKRIPNFHRTPTSVPAPPVSDLVVALVGGLLIEVPEHGQAVVGVVLVHERLLAAAQPLLRGGDRVEEGGAGREEDAQRVAQGRQEPHALAGGPVPGPPVAQGGDRRHEVRGLLRHEGAEHELVHVLDERQGHGVEDEVVEGDGVGEVQRPRDEQQDGDAEPREGHERRDEGLAAPREPRDKVHRVLVDLLLELQRGRVRREGGAGDDRGHDLRDGPELPQHREGPEEDGDAAHHLPDAHRVDAPVVGLGAAGQQLVGAEVGAQPGVLGLVVAPVRGVARRADVRPEGVGGVGGSGRGPRARGVRVGGTIEVGTDRLHVLAFGPFQRLALRAMRGGASSVQYG